MRRVSFAGEFWLTLGADVIKIESQGGDPSRNTAPFYHDIPHPEKSLFWFAYNANKREITLNLETHQGKDILRRLIKRADFVLESFPLLALNCSALLRLLRTISLE